MKVFKEKNKEKLEILILALSDYVFRRRMTLTPEALETAKELDDELMEALKVMTVKSK